MKLLSFFTAAFLLLALPGAAHARSDVTVGFWGGYSYSSGTYLDRIERTVPEDVNRNQYAAGLDLWLSPHIIQVGFMFGVNSLYSMDKTLEVTKSGDKWVSNPGETHDFELSAVSMPLMMTARLLLPAGLYIGAGTGYHLLLKKPAIDGEAVSDYGDDGLVAMGIVGWDFRVARKTLIGLSFRALWGFEQKYAFTSYIPAVTVSFEL